MDENENERVTIAIAMCLNMALFSAVKTSSKMEISKMFEMIKYNLINQGLNPDVVSVSIEEMRESGRQMRKLLW